MTGANGIDRHLHADQPQTSCKISGKSSNGFGLPNQLGSRADISRRLVARRPCRSECLAKDTYRKWPSMSKNFAFGCPLRQASFSAGHRFLGHCRINRAFVRSARGRPGSVGGGAHSMTVRWTYGRDCRRPGNSERTMAPYASAFGTADPGVSFSPAGSCGWPRDPRPSGGSPQLPATLRPECPLRPNQAPVGSVRAWRCRQSSR